ncbi:3-oxoacyl-[acyl-carrier-protein] reductase FabG [Aliiroseovarius sp. xm-m-379]|uniref:SDR family NAD(P)-dependent oxidoreductase n=1 Tax=unclassified Aliiroseovarius TaxID=2623558 RepID=UPI00156A2F97|nr:MULTISPECIES: SDR family oxidoreductase [unclassified Aliiroseovarius]NRP13821.1 3-oxoacyl-[acyl-carrier-protein] reductase FabG [Aliiroseovarius sp. xm-d-517]NRP25534.1 3-oxoacyl-[acyl-carrier-protein] reductase FabG [Aliiroseovarius sp. xm-m-379]NRP29526.1 3-oxoacyl-[acyl-carrier-protein] reductase FabG [Aliiroseovarius sp. xm-m-314]NRP34333.1 3-oxoacyl-[acyl-carrier-protein] reductase FabG [Aliiroseovarius sp. xm-a-104]NRP41708.1 3-oxoacyl-[acyl-carrier-protein] reductase FabG [Aliiroseo
MSFSIAGKTAIVTGAANGIGLAIARHFADHGANVVCADMDEEGLLKEWGNNPEDDEGSSSNTRIFAGDLREKLTIANLLSATIDAFEQVDILINASRQVMISDPLDADNTAMRTLLDQNLMTSLRLSQLVAKRMIQQGLDLSEDDQDTPLGAIVNLSSIAACRTQPGLLAYSVASAAVDQMTRSLAVALAPSRIRVNAISFGSLMSASLRETIKANKSTRADIIEGTPLGRIASATEIAEAAQFLCSDGSSFMTGHILQVDGGRSLLDVVSNPSH